MPQTLSGLWVAWGPQMKTDTVAASDFEPQGKHAALWAYWRTLQATHEGIVPPRSAFRPADVSNAITSLALSEYIDRDTQIIRLIGSHHDNQWPPGSEGKNLFDFVDEDTANARKDIYDAIVSAPCGCFLSERAVTPVGRRVRYTGLVLPLLNSAAEPKIFIGSYNFRNDRTGRTGRDEIVETGASAEKAGVRLAKSSEITFIDLAS